MSKAKSRITQESGVTTVCVTRDFPAGNQATAPRVWEIIADFAGLKKIFPNLLRIYVTYPNDTGSPIGTVRDMTFAPSSPDHLYPLPMGVEQLVELNDKLPRLKYISALGLPVKDYASVMEVTGANACTLTWTSTYLDNGGGAEFANVLAGILASGADQIARTLKVR